MILSYWTLFVALSLSLVAAWYSIAGLTAIFAAAAVPIMIMGGIMEVAKITVTVWLHEYWQHTKRSLKAQLTASVVLLMFITSMGIFGYLSKAHSDQSLVSGDVMAKISIYDEKIKVAKDNIDANRKALKQMDEAVDQVMGRSADEKGADKAVALRRGQAKERTRLLQEIAAEQKLIAQLSEERAPIAAEVRKVEAEVGPIKYIAALVYGDNPDANLLERAVRWVIVILVVVFDPLAIAMVLSATESLKWEKEWRARKPEDPPVEQPEVKPTFNEIPEWEQPEVEQTIVEPVVEPPVEEIVEPPVEEIVVEEPEVEEIEIDEPVRETVDIERPGDYITDAEKEAMKLWKAENPDDTLKHQRALFDHGMINQLPWMKFLSLQPDDTHTGNMTGFGIAFPTDPTKGDMFLRVDQIPSVLYKFNGTRWIEVDKNLSDQYAYDEAYIDHLISKIETGEYDPELLSDAERDQIEHRLNNK